MNAISIGTLAFTALYLLITYAYFGMTESISATFYSWQKRSYSAAFVWFCLVITLGAWLQWIYPLKEVTKLLLLAAGFFMFCIGVASTYKDSKVSTLHYVFAVLTITLGFAAVTYEQWGAYGCWVPFALFVVLSAAVKRFWPKNSTYWIEVIALILIFSFL